MPRQLVPPSAPAAAAGAGQVYLRGLINQLSIDINKYKTEIDKINRLLRIQQNNNAIVTPINNMIGPNGFLLLSPDIANNCAIFKYCFYTVWRFSFVIMIS